MSFARKLSLLVIMSAFIPLGIFAGVTIYSIGKYLTEYSAKEFANIADDKKTKIETRVIKYIEDSTLMSADPALVIAITNYNENPTNENIISIDNVLDRMQNKSNWEKVNILDKNSNIINTRFSDEMEAKHLFSDYKNQSSSAPIILYDDTQGIYNIGMVQKIIYKGSVEGYLLLKLSLDEIKAFVQDYTFLGDTGEIELIHRLNDGSYLIFTPPRKNPTQTTTVVRKGKEGPLIKAALDQVETTYYNTQDFMGNTVLGVTRYLPNTNWGMVAKISYQELYKPLQMLVIVAIAVLLIIMGLTSLVSQAIAQNLIKPVKELTNATEKIVKGDLNARVNITAADELGNLARAFNKMTAELADLYKNLEEKVKEKTQDTHKFMQAVQSASDIIIITDLAGTIVYINPAMSKLTGYTSKDLLNKSIDEISIPENKEIYTKMFDEVRTTKKAVFKEILSKTKSGSTFMSEIHLSPISNDEGSLEYFVIIGRDITNLKDIEKTKSAFIESVARELQTPLGAMKYFLELLEEDNIGFTQRQNEHFNDMKYINSGMLNLVSELINISHIEAGTLQINPERTDLKQIVRNIVKDIATRANYRNIKIVTDIADKLPEVKVDAVIITEIYKNLILNAVKYSNENSTVNIRISYNDNEIISEVIDKGVGIPTNEQNKVFTRFFRAQNAGNVEGAGLGLYLTDLLVKECGGKITFTSTEGAGTSMTFTIPIKGIERRQGTTTLEKITLA